jgi:hypothetical protein
MEKVNGKDDTHEVCESYGDWKITDDGDSEMIEFKIENENSTTKKKNFVDALKFADTSFFLPHYEKDEVVKEYECGINSIDRHGGGNFKDGFFATATITKHALIFKATFKKS